MKTTMTINEVVEILKMRATAYLQGLNGDEKKALADDYKRRTKRINLIFAFSFMFVCLVFLAVAAIVYLYELDMVYLAISIAEAVLFLVFALFFGAQVDKIRKMSNDEAMLNGALKYIQKNTPMQALRAIVTGDVSVAGASVPSTPTNQPNATIGSDSVPPATSVNESVSGKESEGEGDKQEGEFTRQKLSAEGKSVAEILAELKGLYEQGLITEADYERKKAEMLEKM